MYIGDLNRYQFYKGTRDRLLKEIYSSIRGKKKKFIITANPETISNSIADSNFGNVLNFASEMIADGIGIIWAEKLLGRSAPLHYPGIELMQDIFENADEQKVTIFLLGAKEDTLRHTKRKIEQRFPNVIIVGYQHGYFEDNRMVVRNIQKAQPDCVFVALGSPLQEQWIYNNIDQFEHGIFMGVGGSFDVLSGEVQRAPRLMRDLHMEWAYRISKHPQKHKKIKSLITYCTTILSAKLTKTFKTTKIPEIHTRDTQ
ncbi:WecB/TagA/CpsF family glycosyltransferase [Bacillus sp. ISL-41]|uniref:WecB/TagA/CpsF family glycosyltransferase n=1 Tax=Bacillus sp. ISL-41 TaxID=2819127 RepID=UPI001BE5EBD1|nr:WecB/TagA/CpsF family glycosyltransferase [Bacillus sp. ISL-41]MBT2643624.1 WecB/TagA/CpsF family glycosyltransferase [Bacillus sp. ISL-41]